MGLFKALGIKRENEAKTREEMREARIYDYETPEGRASTAEWLLQQAKNERTGREDEWKRYEDYYNGIHDVSAELKDQLEMQGIDWNPPVIPDPYIMVESQIIPDIPEPEFRGREGDADSQKAKERGLAVKYICEANRIGDMNTANERRLRKYGDAFWKAYWDDEMRCGDRRGDIRIKDVPVEDLYIDPTAGKDGLQAAEYVIYIYSMHKLRFWRMYRNELAERGIALEDITGKSYHTEEGMFEPFTAAAGAQEDLVQVMEFWYRTPDEADGIEAGSIACSIQAGGQEIRHIPHYWEETGKQCKLFPFVHYWCIRDESQFYNRSELAPILSMVDGADRELAMGVLNDAFMANDIILIEDGALPEGEEFTNAPGAQVRVNQGRAGGVARLGGLGNGVKSLSMVEWMLSQVQRTNRNFDSNNGRETSKVNTASGLLQLRTDAQAQQQLKRADRDAGFCRLYELLDWLALEFYRDDRLLFIGAKNEHEKPEALNFNGARFAVQTGAVVDPVSEEMQSEGGSYYPRVDVTVSCGDPIGKSPAMTLQVLDKLAATQATPDNWKLLAAELELLDIPGKQEIIERWRSQFEPTIPPEVTRALESDPGFLQFVSDIVEKTDAENAARAAGMSAGGFSPAGDIPAYPAPAGGGAGLGMAAEMPMRMM